MQWTREDFFASLKNQSMNPWLSSPYPGKMLIKKKIVGKKNCGDEVSI